MPLKETNFFVFEGQKVNFLGPGDNEKINSYSVTDLNTYLSLFQNIASEKAIGEASALYLYSEVAPQRIKIYCPRVKLIAILRQPVTRAFSHFKMNLKQQREPFTNFLKAFWASKSRIQNHWGWTWDYIGAGFYYERLKKYFSIFNKTQIKVFLYELAFCRFFHP